MRTRLARAKFKAVFQQMVKQSSKVLDEAAFPAYAHRNPVIDHIFWQRLAAAERYLQSRKNNLVLDFGCGSGVMSYILAGNADKVIATDIEPASWHQMHSAVVFPPNIQFASATELESEDYSHRFDAIVALDVLEHVDDLPAILRQFRAWLKPGGVAVISGPTENALYKLGRRLAGNRFTGEYHVSNISRIESTARQHGTVSPIAVLYPVFPLFKVFALHFPDAE